MTNDVNGWMDGWKERVRSGQGTGYISLLAGACAEPLGDL